MKEKVQKISIGQPTARGTASGAFVTRLSETGVVPMENVVGPLRKHGTKDTCRGCWNYRVIRVKSRRLCIDCARGDAAALLKRNLRMGNAPDMSMATAVDPKPVAVK